MVAFNKDTDLPANIDTVEKLAVWSLCLLQEIFPTQNVYEEVGANPQLIAQAGIFDINIPNDTWQFTKTYRFIGRVSIPATIAHKKGTKYWQSVSPIGVGTIPLEYKS